MSKGFLLKTILFSSAHESPSTSKNYSRIPVPAPPVSLWAETVLSVTVGGGTEN